jgi:hypothetical protein
MALLVLGCETGNICGRFCRQKEQKYEGRAHLLSLAGGFRISPFRRGKNVRVRSLQALQGFPTTAHSTSRRSPLRCAPAGRGTVQGWCAVHERAVTLLGWDGLAHLC